MNELLKAHHRDSEAPVVLTSTTKHNLTVPPAALTNAYAYVDDQPNVRKDPRVCLLMPLWCAAFGESTIEAMVLFEHPDQVVSPIHIGD